MGRRSPLDYAYAVGRVRALETRLVGKAVFREAAAAASLAAALKIVREAGRFADGLAEVRSGAALDAALGEERAALDALLVELLPGTRLPEVVARDARPHEALALAEEEGLPFVTAHLRRAVDLANIKLFLRARFLGLPRERFAALALRGGLVGAELYIGAYAGTEAEMSARLAPTPYRGVFEAALRGLAERETFVDLERTSEDLLMAGLRPALGFVFGPEPVYAFGLAKLRELALVRLVASGKLNGLPPALIAERISDTYV